MSEMLNDPETPATVRMQAARSLAAKRLEVAPERVIERPVFDWSSFEPDELEQIQMLFERADRRKQA